MKQILRTIVVVWSVLAGLTAWGQGDYVKPALTIDEVVVAPETKPWAFPTHEAPQVDPSSGSGSMAVELFSWNVGKFPMSISLGYALGGHKMEEKSGLIGLGWRLSCAGMVYRDVAGLPDESKQFLFLSSEEIDSRESNDMSSDDRLGGGARYLDQVERRDVDALYDRYHYQFPGHSGSFIIKNGAVIMLPQDNVTITLFGDTGIDNVKNFRITTPDGTKYEFSEREHTDYVHPLSGTKPGYSGLTYYNAVTKWHLKRIITPEGVDTITYHYDTLPLWNINRNHSSQSYGVVFDNPGYNLTSSSPLFTSNSPKIQIWDSRMLKKISSRTATVEFSHYPRIKMEEEPKYISGIKIYNQDGTEVRNVTLTAGSLTDGRRVLKSVNVTSEDVLLDHHEFTYNNKSERSPGDFFGYANGVASFANQSVIDHSTGMFNQQRKPSPVRAVHGAMASHTTAMGLHTTYEYEPNSMSGDSVIIGVRVKRIHMTDRVSGRTQTREYAYSDPMCTIDLTKVGITPFVSFSGLSWVDTRAPFVKEGHSVSASMLSASRLPGHPLSEARVYYGKAVEEISGTGLDHPIRTEYEYDTSRCELRRVGGTGEAYTDNQYYIKGDMHLPDNGGQFLAKLFTTGFANYYYAECTFATPRLKIKRDMVWDNNRYRPWTEKEYFYSLTDSAAYYTGLHHETLVKDFKNYYMVLESTYNSLRDFSYVSTAIVCGRWRLDSVAEKRFYGSGVNAPVSEAGTAYAYTRRQRELKGDNVWWARPQTRVPEHVSLQSNIPIIPFPDTGETEGLEQILIANRSRVFGDTIVETAVYELPIGTVTYSAGHKTEHHVAYSGQSYDYSKSLLKTLPLAEMWIVDGRDSLLKRYEYGSHHGLTLPSRVSLGLKGSAPMAEQRFTSYTSLGQPKTVIKTGAPKMICNYMGDLVISLAYSSAERTLASYFSHIPLVGCTSVSSPWGGTETFEYSGARLSAHKIGLKKRMLDEYAYELYNGGGSANRIVHTSYAADSAAVTSELFDGFGTAIGSVSEGYGCGSDVMTATRLDALGRVIRQWTPLPVNDIYGALRNDNPLAAAANDLLGDGRAYTEYKYRGSAEKSPWQVTLAGTDFAGHPSSASEVCSNPSIESLKVRRLTWNGSELRCNGFYAAGELHGTRQQDADGVTVTTFVDALGREVLRRAGSGDLTADTYTVCDSWGNPLLIVQPMGSALLDDDAVWRPGNLLIDEYCFVYRYDSKLRLVSAKAPGCAPVLTAYDTLGRVAFTRDGLSASTGRMWFHLYDGLYRPAVSGLCPDFLSDDQWNMEHETPTPTRKWTHGDAAPDYDWDALNLPEGAVVTDALYYDRYLPEMLKTQGIKTPMGLPTTVRSSVLRYGMVESAVFLSKYYNELGQVMLTEEKWDNGYKSLVSNSLTLGGLPLQRHTYVSGGFGGLSLTEYSSYDRFGRVATIKAQASSSGLKLMEQNGYDSAGRLASRLSEGGVATTYGYDARGVMTDINNPLVSMKYHYASGTTERSFAGRISGKTMTYREGKGFHVKRHAYSYDPLGRLVSASLKDGGSFMPFPSDWPALSAAAVPDSAVSLPTDPFRPTLAGADNSELFTYDLNANILSISRMGRTDNGAYKKTDEMAMEYLGNRIVAMTDFADDVYLEASMDVPSGCYNGRDFGYDAAGHLTRDVSRGISNIAYSVAGLPEMIGTMYGDCLSYDYTSQGQKLAETVWNGSKTSRREYIGPMELLDGRLVRTNMPQGYFDSLGVFHAYIPDIQGNIVGVYEAKQGVTQLEQLNEYYAYGALTADSRGQDANRRKYTAKELTTDLGLNTYDFSARRQYPAVGRFDAPDSKTHEYRWLSPYAFCAGDPINFADPTGNDYALVIDDENKTMTIIAKYFACTPDMPSLNKALSFWNGQSGLHSIGGYVINFDLQAVEVSEYIKNSSSQMGKDTHRHDAAKTAAIEYNESADLKIGNSYTVLNHYKSNVAGYTNDGFKIIENKEYSHETTGAHEIGHSIGMPHDINNKGIMSLHADLNRGWHLTSDNVTNMIFRAISPQSFSIDANLGKGSKIIVNKTIERLYTPNYYKVKK